jgi:hypothetical protein
VSKHGPHWSEVIGDSVIADAIRDCLEYAAGPHRGNFAPYRRAEQIEAVGGKVDEGVNEERVNDDYEVLGNIQECSRSQSPIVGHVFLP